MVRQPKIQTLYFSGLIPGWHQLRIEDANGCILTKDFEIQEPSPIDVSLPPLVKINEAENLTLKPVFQFPQIPFYGLVGHHLNFLVVLIVRNRSLLE